MLGYGGGGGVRVLRLTRVWIVSYSYTMLIKFLR